MYSKETEYLLKRKAKSVGKKFNISKDTARKMIFSTFQNDYAIKKDVSIFNENEFQKFLDHEEITKENFQDYKEKISKENSLLKMHKFANKTIDKKHKNESITKDLT